MQQAVNLNTGDYFWPDYDKHTVYRVVNALSLTDTLSVRFAAVYDKHNSVWRLVQSSWDERFNPYCQVQKVQLKLEFIPV